MERGSGELRAVLGVREGVVETGPGHSPRCVQEMAFCFVSCYYCVFLVGGWSCCLLIFMFYFLLKGKVTRMGADMKNQGNEWD